MKLANIAPLESVINNVRTLKTPTTKENNLSNDSVEKYLYALIIPTNEHTIA